MSDVPRRVLVTGAAGRLGRMTLDLLARLGVPATALDLHDPGGLAADRVVTGNAGDSAAVRDALDGVDAVIHLAAIPAPVLGTPEEVFCGNTRATFVVLEEAGQAGVRRAAIASSFSVLGLPLAARPLHPAYVPVDEALPLQIEDPYGLSKQADEATGAMMARRHGMTVVALRFPLLGGPATSSTDRRPIRRRPRVGRQGAVELSRHPRRGPGLLASRRPADRGLPRDLRDGPGHAGPAATEELLDRFHPEVERRAPLPGRTVPIDLGEADRLLGLTIEHPHPDATEPTEPLPAPRPRHPGPPGTPCASPRSGRSSPRPRAFRWSSSGSTPPTPGLYGLGCATFTQRFHAVVGRGGAARRRRWLIGRHPADIEDITRMVHYSSYWRGGPVLNNALSGVDQALWDIAGKRAGMPVYELLGGRARAAVEVYMHAGGGDHRGDPRPRPSEFIAARLPQHPAADRPARRWARTAHPARPAATRRSPHPDGWDARALSARHAGAVRGAPASGSGTDIEPDARRAQPAHAQAGGRCWPGRWSRTGCRSWRTRSRRSTTTGCPRCVRRRRCRSRSASRSARSPTRPG